MSTVIKILFNAANETKQIVTTEASNFIRKGLYTIGLSSTRQDKKDSFDDNKEQLCLGHYNKNRTAPVEPLINEIILKKNRTTISFIDAKIKLRKVMTIKAQPLTGIQGSIKEYIQASDYMVDISGHIILDNQYAFPIQELKILNEILTSAETLDVANVYLNNVFNIEKLVFKDGTFDQGQIKYINIMPFSLSFMSDINHSFLLEDQI